MYLQGHARQIRIYELAERFLQGKTLQTTFCRSIGEKVRPYELMVIFDQDQDENDVKKATSAYCDQISKAGAKLGNVDHWGKRKFAYPINKKLEGYYVVIQAKAQPDVMTELSRQLGLATEIVRHMVLRIPESQYVS